MPIFSKQEIEVLLEKCESLSYVEHFLLACSLVVALFVFLPF